MTRVAAHACDLAYALAALGKELRDCEDCREYLARAAEICERFGDVEGAQYYRTSLARYEANLAVLMAGDSTRH